MDTRIRIHIKMNWIDNTDCYNQCFVSVSFGRIRINFRKRRNGSGNESETTIPGTGSANPHQYEADPKQSYYNRILRICGCLLFSAMVRRRFLLRGLSLSLSATPPRPSTFSYKERGQGLLVLLYQLGI